MSRANARIYREAARKIAEGEGRFSCNEIDRVSHYKPKCRKRYSEIFDLGKGDSFSLNVYNLWADSVEYAQTRRVLMLLLAAEIEFDGRL